MNLTRDDVIDILLHDLPVLVEEHPELRRALAEALSDTVIRREEFRDVLDEIKVLREDFSRGFQEHSARMEELREDFNRRMDAFDRRMDAFEQRMDAFDRRMDAFEQRMEEFSRRMEEFSRRMEEFSRRMEEHAQSIGRLERTIGALGARWGIMSEQAFRDGVRGILQTAGWRVERFLERDVEGMVFGRPDWVELDVVISDGAIVLVELKSSISRADMYSFHRKVAFYEKVKGVTVSRRVVISPFIEDRAMDMARELGVEVYTSESEFRPEGGK